MAEQRDQDYLLHSQYKDATNFSARVNLHRRFSVNKYGWHRWVFDQMQMSESGSMLELGCGPGLLWLSNLQRIPTGWRIILSDFSPGMLQEARQRLGEQGFSYQVVDAQAIPFADASFDAIIANHMLYHVPDLSQALTEIRRVLKPGGHLYATTIGRGHMREMDDLVRRALPDVPWQGLGDRLPFLLENGQELLAPFFSPVALFTYEDALEVTEAEPLIAYARSGRLGSHLDTEQIAQLRALIQHELAAYGTIRITNASGMFTATKKP
ncbi:MAG TPA: class I SAM-dependent methyltransferase [Ktedonobacteraceae bacterium]|jgi:SAM-dependent methyltransferase